MIRDEGLFMEKEINIERDIRVIEERILYKKSNYVSVKSAFGFVKI